MTPATVALHPGVAALKQLVRDQEKVLGPDVKKTTTWGKLLDLSTGVRRTSQYPVALGVLVGEFSDLGYTDLASRLEEVRGIFQDFPTWGSPEAQYTPLMAQVLAVDTTPPEDIDALRLTLNDLYHALGDLESLKRTPGKVVVCSECLRPYANGSYCVFHPGHGPNLTLDEGIAYVRVDIQEARSQLLDLTSGLG